MKFTSRRTVSHLSLPSVHGRLREGLPDLKLDLRILEGGGGLHGVLPAGFCENDGGRGGVAHFAHHHAHA